MKLSISPLFLPLRYHIPSGTQIFPLPLPFDAHPPCDSSLSLTLGHLPCLLDRISSRASSTLSNAARNRLCPAGSLRWGLGLGQRLGLSRDWKRQRLCRDLGGQRPVGVQRGKTKKRGVLVLGRYRTA